MLQGNVHLLFFLTLYSFTQGGLGTSVKIRFKRKYSKIWKKLETAKRSSGVQQQQKGLNYFLLYSIYYTWTGRVCAQSCPALCIPVDCSPPVCSVRGILQARILEWVAVSSSRVSSRPQGSNLTLASPPLVGGFFTTAPLAETVLSERTGRSKCMLRYNFL